MVEQSKTAALRGPARRTHRCATGVGSIRPVASAAALAVLGLGLTATTRANTTVTTTTAYDYEAATGFLNKTVTEPTNSNLCLVINTTQRDGMGNPKTVVTRNCNGSAATAPGGVAEAPAPSGLAVFSARTQGVTYTVDGRFINTATNAAGQPETFFFDSFSGQPITDQDANQLTVSDTYDWAGRKVLEMKPDGTGTRYFYFYCNNVQLPSGGMLAVPTGQPSAACAAVQADSSVVQPGPTLTPIYYVQATPVKSDGVTAIGGYARVYYDTLGREVRTETQGFDGSGTSQLVYVDTQYNSLGKVAAKSAPYYAGSSPAWTQYKYDNLGRVTQVSEPSAVGTSITHTAYSGLTTTITDANTHGVTQVNNIAGLLATTTDAKGSLTRLYDPLGNLVQTTDALGNVTSLAYDVRSRKTALYDPDMGHWSYVYDAAGDAVQQTDGKGQVSTRVFDVLGRMKSRSEVGLNSTWYYDANADGSACGKGKGKLCQETTDTGVQRSLVYDNDGRLSTTTTTIGGAGYVAASSYDPVTGRLSSVTYPSGVQVNSNYTPLGYLSSLTDARTSAALWTAKSMDAHNSVLQALAGNNVTTTNTYYVDGRMHTTQSTATDGTAVQNLNYGYDAMRNISSRLDLLTGVSSSYFYDELNRLQNETRSGGGVGNAQVISWTYDAIGNIATRTDPGQFNQYYYNTSGLGSLRPHAVGSVAGAVDGVGNANYTYDANGNMSSGANRGVTWTSYNMVQSITEGAQQLQYWYDPEHGRVKETSSSSGALQRTTLYVSNGDQPFYEEDSGVAGSQKRHYVSLNGNTVAVIVCTTSPCTTASNSTTQWWHEDHLGSVSVVSDANGHVLERMAYEPFGKRRQSNGVTDPNGTLAATTTHRGFTEQEHLDEVGLINMNGRVYDPALGRFMSADPNVQFPSAPQSYNRYSYIRNNPLRATDPSGFDEGGDVGDTDLSSSPDDGTEELSYNCPDCGSSGSQLGAGASIDPQFSLASGNASLIGTGQIGDPFSLGSFNSTNNFAFGLDTTTYVPSPSLFSPDITGTGRWTTSNAQFGNTASYDCMAAALQFATVMLGLPDPGRTAVATGVAQDYDGIVRQDPYESNYTHNVQLFPGLPVPANLSTDLANGVSPNSFLTAIDSTASRFGLSASLMPGVQSGLYDMSQVVANLKAEVGTGISLMQIYLPNDGGLHTIAVQPFSTFVLVNNLDAKGNVATFSYADIQNGNLKVGAGGSAIRPPVYTIQPQFPIINLTKAPGG